MPTAAGGPRARPRAAPPRWGGGLRPGRRSPRRGSAGGAPPARRRSLRSSRRRSPVRQRRARRGGRRRSIARCARSAGRPAGQPARLVGVVLENEMHLAVAGGLARTVAAISPRIWPALSSRIAWTASRRSPSNETPPASRGRCARSSGAPLAAAPVEIEARSPRRVVALREEGLGVGVK